jgi:hypothetical protein
VKLRSEETIRKSVTFGCCRPPSVEPEPSPSAVFRPTNSAEEPILFVAQERVWSADGRGKDADKRRMAEKS